MYGFIELLGDLVAEGSVSFEPTVILLGQQVYNFKEDGVVLFAFIFGEFSQGLVDVACFPG